jgi:hypothetical protein
MMLRRIVIAELFALALSIPLPAFAASAVIPESTVVIHFVDPAEIAKALPSRPVAYSLPSRSPCEVWLPKGMWVWGDDKNYPYLGRFIDANDAGLFAHEILHCVIGGWHPQ